MKYIQAINPILSKTEDNYLKSFLENSIQNFYEELDNFCIKNDNYDFGEEATFGKFFKRLFK